MATPCEYARCACTACSARWPSSAVPRPCVRSTSSVRSAVALIWNGIRSPLSTFLLLSANETARRLAQDAIADKCRDRFVALALIEIPQARRLPPRQAQIRDRSVFRLDLHRDGQDAI